jgi:hypothetical protein
MGSRLKLVLMSHVGGYARRPADPRPEAALT